jgi:shikimate kinase/3-dehydroquinate synthase
MRSVVLSGFMGVGKSTLAPLVAKRLGLPLVDTDAELERATGAEVRDLLVREGEVAFREREAELVASLLEQDVARVFAFGGGTVTTDRVRRLALDRALVVTLTASPESIVARVRDLAGRPNLNVSDPIARARELMARRAGAYAECHLTIPTDTVGSEAAVEAVARLAERDPLAVALGARSYCVDVCCDEPGRLSEAVGVLEPSSIVLVMDSNIRRLRGSVVEGALAPLGLEAIRVTLAPGEVHKNLGAVSTIWDAALGAGVDRDAVVVAVGGGVVGDLAGFAAACLLRGVRFVQVPTTTLAMVDASVGGKTGCDHAVGKNLVGAFHQPKAVVADLAHLQTLPERERRAGLAEVVKIAVATDAGLLAELERSAAEISRGEPAALTAVVRASIRAKARVVGEDEREAGARSLLNLGHTAGHALEAHAGYTRWLHGEAVSLGLLAEMRATTSLGWTPVGLVGRIRRLLEALGLPTEVDRAELTAAWPYVLADKKRTRGAVRLPVVRGDGRASVIQVGLDELRSAMLS